KSGFTRERKDERILKAAHRLNLMGAVGLILLGDKEAINSKNLNLNLENVEIIDPNTSHYREEFAKSLYELRKSKGLSEQEAKQLVLDKTYFATMLVHSGYVHAMVSGVNHSDHTRFTNHQNTRREPGFKRVFNVFRHSSASLWGLRDYPPPRISRDRYHFRTNRQAIQYCASGLAFLCDRRFRSRRNDRQNQRSFNNRSKVGSPIRNWPLTIRFHKRSQEKMPNSQVAGQASVFIFPDLNAGNIAYKAVQRSAKAVAIGPILQGLNKPINDLSRGALVEDIINTVLISALQAQD
nr:phosphate acetyltransferase - Helicobacter pylori (strain 26695) [Helicobacter pylori]